MAREARSPSALLRRSVATRRVSLRPLCSWWSLCRVSART